MISNCAIPYASNYNPEATGCPEGTFANGINYPAGTIFCCDFRYADANISEWVDAHFPDDRNSDLNQTLRESSLDIPENDCGVSEDDTTQSLSGRQLSDLNTKYNSLSSIRNGDDNVFDSQPRLAIPIVFYDIYGGNPFPEEGDAGAGSTPLLSFCNASL